MASRRGHGHRPHPGHTAALLALLVSVAALVAGILAGCGGGGSQTATAPPAASTAATGGSEPAAPGDPSPAFERAARRALVSVVQINSGQSIGSGVVLDDRGDIVTNAHVVAGSRRFDVIGADGGHHRGTLRGSFRAEDLAVVHVENAGLRAARFADSSKLAVGEVVLAVGSPLGLRSSVTQGIVSAVSRTVSEGNGITLPSAVQTSAAINPGNSGGALVDLTGAVVGIPTLAAVDPTLGRADGIGFAISSNRVKVIAPQLAAQGRVTSSGRAFLGVELGSLVEGGALIVRVENGGPAAKAGLKAGDRIVAIGGRGVQSADDVAVALARHRPGDRVTVEVRRQNGARASAQVQLGQLPGG
jgi:S1-C subfamily serine protease